MNVVIWLLALEMKSIARPVPEQKLKTEVLHPHSPYVTDAFRILAEAFVDEPLSVSLQRDDKLRLKGWTQFTNHFVDECSANGMSVVCVDEKTDKVAATLIVRDFCSPLPTLLEECIEKWKDPGFGKKCDYASFGPLFEILGDVDEKFVTNRFPEGLELGKVADFWMGGTDPNYRRKGLLTRCFSKATELAREKGFKYSIAECTSAYSAHSMLSIGARPVVATDYADFKVSDGRVGLDVEHPHTKLEIYEQVL